MTTFHIHDEQSHHKVRGSIERKDMMKSEQAQGNSLLKVIAHLMKGDITDVDPSSYNLWNRMSTSIVSPANSSSLRAQWNCMRRKCDNISNCRLIIDM